MATEINIQESVFLKKGEREENALTSESFEEKLTELPGNIMKQLETSSLVAETVNTPLETGKPTDESETFFQALSVPLVIADEHSNEPESCKAAKKTEPEEETVENEEKASESEVCEKDAPKKDEAEVGSKLFDSMAPGKKVDLNMLEKNQGDSDGVTSSQDAACEDIKETTTEQYATTVADFKEQDLNREFLKEETEDKSVDALEASEQCEIESKDIEEQTFEENVKKIEQDEEIREIKPDVELEQNGMLQAITSDACISTETKSHVETAEHEQKDEDANVLEEDHDKDEITNAQEIAFKGDSQEKNHHSEDDEHQVVEAKESTEEDNDVCVSTQTDLVEESIKNEETNDEKAIEKEVCEEKDPKKAEFEEALEVSDCVALAPSQKETFNVLEKDKGDSDGVTSSQEAPCVAVEETTTDQHVTTVIDFKEQDLNEKPREFIKEETEDKSLDAQEASEECENGAKKEIEENSGKSVKKIEKDEETEESVTIIQTKSQVEKPEHEEEEICEETGSEKVEYEKEVEDSAVAIINKDKVEDEDEKKDQEVSGLEKDEGEDGVTSAQDVAFEKDLQEKIHHNEDDESEIVTAEESIEKDSEDIRSSEKTEQQMQIDSIPSDVCISTQTEPEEEKTITNDEEAIERDDGQTNKSATPIIKEIGEENVSEKTESEEAKDKSVDVQEETEQYDDGANSEKEQKLEESVDESAHSYSKNEQEEYAEEIKPSVETIEEKGVCISTQIESQEDATKNEENDIVSDGDRKDKSDNPFVKEVCDENDLKKTESEEEIQLSDSSNVKTRESVDADNEEGVKHSDGFDTTLNENEILSKEEKLEKEEEIKTSEVQGGGDDVTSSQSASNEDIKETTGQHDTNVTYVEEGQGVCATPKEILIEEAEDKPVDAQEISLELGQPNEQYVEETNPCLSKTISENPEDEIKKDEKYLSQESVDDTNDDTTKEEKGTLEQETVEEQIGQDDVSKEKVIDLNETTEIEPQEDITRSTSLETSTKDTSNSEKEQAESENLPTIDLELVPKSDDSMLKEECSVSETETHLDEEKETVTKEISSDEKTEVQGGGDDVTSSQNTSSEDIQETTTDQHDTTVACIEEEEGVSATSKEILIEEAEYKSVDAEKMSLERVQSNEQNVEETLRLCKTISQKPEAGINKENKYLSHESVEDTNDNATKEEKCTLQHEPVEGHNGRDEVSKEEITDSNETTEVENQEDITPSGSLEASKEDTSISEKEKAESENLQIEDLETVSEVKIPEMVPRSEESVLKEECFISETETGLDEEKGTVTEEISSDEKAEQTTKIKQEAIKEVCEETSLEKAEFEELKLSDSSNVKINEKEITTFINDDQEKDHEVNMSAESQGTDDITSSQYEVAEEKEDLQGNNYHNEGNEGDFIKSGEGVDEDTEAIKSSVETKELTEHAITTNVCSSTQIQPKEETVENEEKISEKAIENDDNEIVSKEDNLEKKQDDVEETKMGEHVTMVEYYEEGQSLDTTTKDVVTKEEEDKSVVTQEETDQYDDGANDEKEQKPEKDTDEIITSVETNEEKDVCISTQIESQEDATKNEEHATKNDGDQKEKLDDPFVKEVCEENNLKKTESEEERQIPDSFNVKTRESVVEDTKEPKSNDDTKENTDQQGLLHVITTDVYTSTQTEYTEKTTEGEENNDDVQTEKPESSLVEAVGEATSSEITESEDVKHSDSFGTTLNENETLSKEEKLEEEHEIKTSEVQGDGDDVTSSQNASNKDIKETTIGQHDTTVAYVEQGLDVSAMPKEILTEEAENKSIDAEEVSSELGQPEKQYVDKTYPCVSKTIIENPEEEIKKQDKDLSPESVEDTDDTTKEEECTLKQEPVEEHSGRDEVSKENAIDLNETAEVEPQEDITPSNTVENSTEDTSNSESVLKEKFISETETHLDEEKETVMKEISSDEKKEQTVEIKQETVKEICEETSSEKAEFEEGLKLSDGSDIKINEEVITTFKDGEQEKDQEVNVSGESQGEDSITSSQKEVSEEKENLQEKNYHYEGNEHDSIKSREGVDEDTEEIKSSVEIENTEHVITTNVFNSTQTEPGEETTENEDNIGEKAIEYDETEIVSRDENIETKQEDVCSSAQTEAKEETIYNEKRNEEAIENDDGQIYLEKQEKEISEFQGGGDDVISSKNAFNEDTKETVIGQHATTIVQFEEEPGVNALTKDVIGEELDVKSVHAQEASEQCENGANDSTEQQPEETVNKSVNSGSETIKESIQEEEEEEDAGNKKIESTLEAENQADRTEDRSGMKDEVILTENVSKELGQPEEQNVEEIQAYITETISEKTEDEITKDKDLSHDNVTKEEKCFPDGSTKEIIATLEHEPVEEQNDSRDEVSDGKFTDLNETTATVPQEDVTPSSSLGTSTEDTSKDILSDENLEIHGSTHHPENSYSTTEENVTQLEQIGEIKSLNENRDMKEDVTRESQLNSPEDCSEMVKDVILTEEIKQVPLEIEKEKGITDLKEQIVEEDSYSPELEVKSAQNQKEIVHEISNSDSIAVENPEVTEVSVDAQIGQALQGKEEISCVSKVTNDRIDQEPTEEIISSQVDSKNIESTAYPSESEKLVTRALESDCDVQIPEVVADSKDSKVKEESIVLATAEYTDGNNVEEQDIKTNDISSAPNTDQENVTNAPIKSDEAKSSDLIIVEKAITKENLEVHGELEPASEPVTEDQVTIDAKPQPEQSDITFESVKSDPTLESKLEPTSGKDSDGKEDVEEDVTLAPENEIKSIENQNETTKNIILTDEVAMKAEKEKEKNEIEQVSEDDIFSTGIHNTTPNQNELANEIEYSKPMPVRNTEVTEEKAESQIEAENIQAAENLSGSSKASSVIETSKMEMHEDTEQTIIGEVKDDSIYEASKDKTIPVLEDSKASGKTVEDVIINEIGRSISRPDELLETKNSVEDTKDPKFMADNLNVKDETFTVAEGPHEDSEITASEFEKLESTVTEENTIKAHSDKETVTLDESRADDSAKTTYDSISSSTEQDAVARSEESRGHGDMLKLEEKPTEVSKITTEAAEIVPECREASVTDVQIREQGELVNCGSQRPSEDDTLLSQNDNIAEDPEVVPSVEKDVIEGVDKSFEEALVIDVQKHEKDLDHETEVKTADVVSNVECSEIEPPRLDKKEASEFINQENQREQKKEADESIEVVIPVDDVKTSTREVEVRSVDLEVPSFTDATADKADTMMVEEHEAEKGLLKDDEHLESKCDQSKLVEEGSEMKQEQLELDVPETLGTATTKELKISQKYVTDDVLHEPAKENSKVAENLIGEKDSALIKDQRVEKEEIGESGVKTDEEGQEEEDNEDDEKMGSGSDAPVMVEASKDMDVKVHKKSHNILSGVGSKVKHSIAKVKKAITGKSSPPKPPSPKANNQVVG